MTSLRRALKRLRLKNGDILVVRDQELMHTLCEQSFDGIAPVPIVYAEGKNPFSVISKEEMKKLIETP